MSYISAIRTNNDVLVWERNDGQRELKTFRAPYYFYLKDPDGPYVSMFGDKLSRVDFDTASEFQRARDMCNSEGVEMFESDIPSEIRILSEHYYNTPAPKLHVSFLDIEVDYDTEIGFASTLNPYAPINSVSIYHTHLNKYVILAVPPNLAPFKSTDDNWKAGFAPEDFIKQMNDIDELPENCEVRFCANEVELLMTLMVEIEDSDVLCGWNSDFFDVPYIGKRLEKIGKKYLRMMSFSDAEKPTWREVEVMGNKNITLDLSGRISTDYMVLFRKYEESERQSYKLESIAEEILPELRKLEYEGSLASLYRNNFAHFVRYNIRDTEILAGFENKLGYVELANQMMHMSTGVWKHVLGTLKLAELAIVNYCHHVLGGVIVSDFHMNDDVEGGIRGALVLLPQTGMYDWIGSIDINSLYPCSIRSINISPETLRGQFIEEIKAAEEIEKGSLVRLTLIHEDGQQEENSAEEWREILRGRKWVVSGFGTVFDQSVQGVIPRILEDWYNKRKEYQKLKAEAKANNDKELTTYYDKIQYVYKIKLNSFYGALSNRYFRFFDPRMGESTTGTGRRILRHQCAEVCKLLDSEYADTDVSRTEDDNSVSIGYSDKWSVIYGDTDSTYFITHANNEEEAVLVADEVGRLVNDSFQKFMQDTFLCSEGYDNIIQCGREVVSDRGIFVDKKRYILHLIDLEGDKVDKLKVMGLETKKTTLPREVSKEINKFVERLLKGEKWDVIAEDIVKYKENMRKETDVMKIGLPKGIKKVEYYTREFKTQGVGVRLPGHVAAAIFYNICRDEYNDKNSMPIVSGMKIKVFYLTKKYGKFKSIAIPVDIEEVPSWFLEKFTIDRDAHITRLVDKPLQNIIKAIDKEVPTKQGLLVNDLFEF